MKIIVYTIMKNEIHNVESWLENVKQADGIYVMDTGSTDGSYEKMEELTRKYPNLFLTKRTFSDGEFRFDSARNESLDMVPNNKDTICWALDLDERLTDGWYQKTLDAYNKFPKFSVLQCHANDMADNNELISTHVVNKCHQRVGAKWVFPVGESIDFGFMEAQYTDGVVFIGDNVNDVYINHYPNMAKNRDNYMKLLAERVKENHLDLEAMYQLANEYIKRDMFKEAFDMLMLQYSRGLVSDCDWLDVICGNIADFLRNHMLPDEKVTLQQVAMWYDLAISFNTKLRHYYLNAASLFQEEDPELSLLYLKQMYAAKTEPQISWKELEGSWTWLPADIQGVAISWLGQYEDALSCFREARQNADTQYSVQLTDEHIKFCQDKLDQQFNNGEFDNE